ncbi:MAG: site-specific integrase [Paludibacteraceae bacterium]|nr:site-specific integrase [Paludibacteraceae bacterium]
MPTVKAFIRTTAKNLNDVNVRFRYTDGRTVQLFHKSEILVRPDTFDVEKGCIKARVVFDNKRRKQIDKSISDRKELIKEMCIGVADKSVLTSKWLDETIDKKLHPEKYEVEPEIKTLFQFVDKFILHAPERKDKGTGRALSPKNIQQYNATKKRLKEFAQEIGKSDFEFNDLDQLFYDEFVSYLQKLGFTQNSVGKHIKVLKLMLNEATIQGYNLSRYYNSYHVFKEDIDTIYLDEAELQQLKGFDFANTPYLDRVRDWFLLLAWTGCRFSDLEKITKTDIKDGFITFRQQKTNAKVTIPLHPVVVEILEKYDYQMPVPVTNQRFNEYVKEVCRLAEINSVETMTRTVGGKLITEKFEKWEHVTSHTGRRSFCTNMYKRGLPTLMIMSISGHTTEKSFLKYIKVKQEEHAEMMAKKWKEIYK